MYLARFCYDVLPVNRQRAIDFIHREVEAARANRLNARMLVPLTRGHGQGAALQFEVELTSLDQLDQFRNRGVGSSQETSNWMHAFSEIFTAPPCIEIFTYRRREGFLIRSPARIEALEIVRDTANVSQQLALKASRGATRKVQLD